MNPRANATLIAAPRNYTLLLAVVGAIAGPGALGIWGKDLVGYLAKDRARMEAKIALDTSMAKVNRKIDSGNAELFAELRSQRDLLLEIREVKEALERRAQRAALLRKLQIERNDR